MFSAVRVCVLQHFLKALYITPATNLFLFFLVKFYIADLVLVTSGIPLLKKIFALKVALQKKLVFWLFGVA